MRRDHDDARQSLAQDLRDAPLVRRVEEGEEQAHGDGLDAQPHEAVGDLLDRRLIQRPNDSGGAHALVHLEAATARNDRLGRVVAEAVQVGPRLATEPEEVTEAGGGDERRPREPPLEQRVRRDRRAVDEALNGVRADAEPLEHLAGGREHALILVRRREHLRPHDAVGCDRNGVRERPAHVDPERDRHCSSTRVSVLGASMAQGCTSVDRCGLCQRFGVTHPLA